MRGVSNCIKLLTNISSFDLNLSGNKIQDSGVIMIMDRVSHLTKLHTLKLNFSYNQV